MTGYQPIRDQYFQFRWVPDQNVLVSKQGTVHALITVGYIQEVIVFVMFLKQGERINGSCDMKPSDRGLEIVPVTGL